MSLSLHPALWVSAQISPFQRDRHPGKTSSCTITLRPFTLLYFSPLCYIQFLLPSPCARTGYTGVETLFYSLLFPQPRHLTRTTQAFCVPVAVQSPSSPGNVSVGGASSKRSALSLAEARPGQCTSPALQTCSGLLLDHSQDSGERGSECLWPFPEHPGTGRQ